MHISQEVLNQTVEQIKGLLSDNHNDIEEAYCNDESSLNLAISVKYDVPRDVSGISIEAGINFVKERIRQKTVSVVDDKQQPLFGE